MDVQTKEETESTVGDSTANSQHLGGKCAQQYSLMHSISSYSPATEVRIHTILHLF